METNVERVDAGRPDQAGNADRFFRAAQTVFGKAADAKRDMNEETSRTWTIYSPSRLGPDGRPAGYSVVPRGNTSTAFGPSRERGPAGYTFHHFWVTPYREGQLYPVGLHPNRAGSDYSDTLFHYMTDDPIYDTDIVVWYSLGETHLPRPEDYPVMPTAYIGFLLKPHGFFDMNPANDVPPSAKKVAAKSCCHG